MHRTEAVLVLVLGGILILGTVGSAAVTEVDVTVPGGAAETQLATFLTPAGAVTSEVVVGRFLIDFPAPASTDDELVVQVQTHDATQARYQWAAVTLNDPASLGSLEDLAKSPAAADRVIGDLFVCEVPSTPSQPPPACQGVPAIATASTHRLIEVRVVFSSAYTFESGPHTWRIRAFGIPRRCTGDASQVCSSDPECAATSSGTCGSAPDVRYVGFIEGDSTDLAVARADVTKPKLEVEPATVSFGDTQINLDLSQTPVLDFSWSNLGTDAFNPTGGLAPSGGGPYSLFSTPVLTTLAPGATSPLVQMQFRPTQKGSGGPNQETITIAGTAASSGAAVSAPLQLEGNGVSISSILLLDLSDSMNRHVGTGAFMGGTEEDRRLWAAKQAGLQLFDAFDDLTSGEGEFGVYAFPDPANAPPAWDGIPTSAKPVPLNEASLVSGPVTVALGAVGTGGLVADGGTPMHAGLVLAEGDLPNGAGTDDRPSVLLLSDGKHNVPNQDDLPLSVIPSYTAKAARIFSVPFGSPGQSAVDHVMLQSLATGTQGATLPADPADPGAIQKAFRGALRDWLGLRDDADPESTIAPGDSKTHDVCLDDSANQAVFVVDWYEQRDNAISVELETPFGAILTPSSPDLSFSANRSYAMYVVYGRHIRGGRGAGLWKLRLDGSTGLSGSLGYQYSVMTQAVNPPQPSLQLVPGVVERARPLEFYAGDPWLIELSVHPRLKARIEESETGLRARLDAPATSIGTFLATSEVRREWVFERQADRATAAAGQVADGDPLPLAARKADALARYAELRFEDERSREEIQLRDDGREGDQFANDNTFTALLPPSQFDGLYDVAVLLDLVPTARGCSSLHSVVSAYVPIDLASAVMPANVRWVDVVEDLFFDPSVFGTLELSSPPPSGHVRRAAVFTAKDDLGNYLGPGQANQIAFAAEDARLVGPVVDNWDGTYIQVVEYESGAAPAVTVSAGGFSSEPLSPETPRGRLWWLLLILLIVVVAYVVLRLLRTSP